MKVGDKFIYFTKYGGVVKGEIREINNVVCIDITNRARYIKPNIISTNGISYNTGECEIYIIDAELTEEQCYRYQKAFDNAKAMKEKRIREMKGKGVKPKGMK